VFNVVGAFEVWLKREKCANADCGKYFYTNTGAIYCQTCTLKLKINPECE